MGLLTVVPRGRAPRDGAHARYSQTNGDHACQRTGPPVGTIRGRHGAHAAETASDASYLLGLVPVGLIAVMTQAQFVAQFAAEAAARGGITLVTLVVSGSLTLVAYAFIPLVTLVVSGSLTLLAYVFIVRR